MPIRRHSDPTNTQCIWDAINYLTSHKTLAEHDKVLKQLIKMNGYSQGEWEKCIKEALSDELIEIAVKKDVTIYRLPELEYAILDGRDWYCFECHQGGDVVFCRNKVCHRVYHLNCVSKDCFDKFRLFRNLFTNTDSTVFLKRGSLSRRKSLCLKTDGIELVESSSISRVPTYSYDNSLCIVCNMMNLKDYPLAVPELNYLFRFVLHRIRSWIPHNITHRMKGSPHYPEWQTQKDLVWRANHLIFECMDMGIIEDNIYNEKYFNCHNLLKDVLTIKHNIGIFHGVTSQEYAATEFILRDTLHDLGEIIGCVDCYKHSNEQITNNWFAIPCRIPHDIVWAKQKGYCYWPAKVIKESGNHYDVRFFGGKHERAILTQQFIKPISHSKESLHVKKTSTVLKAIEEMELHLKLCKNPDALKDFLASSKKKVSIPRHGRKTPSLLPPNISYIGEEDETRAPMQEVSIPSELPNLIDDTSTKKKRRKSIASSKKDVNNESPTISGIPSELPDLIDDTSTKKRRKSTASSKKDINNESPTISAEVPIKKRKGRSSKKEQSSIIEETTEIVTEAPKKRRGRPPKKGLQEKKGVNKPTKSKSPERKLSQKDTSQDLPDESIRGCEIIDISDGEDNVYTFSGNLTTSAMQYADNYEQQEQVTSSTECRIQENIVQGQEMHTLDHPFSDEVEKMGRKLETMSNKKEMTKYAKNVMQREIDRLTEKHNDHLRKLFDSHNAQISETKKKQWCYYCEQDAIYHCCWNTAYCSTTCQQQHWHAEHKKVCRRKR